MNTANERTQPTGMSTTIYDSGRVRVMVDTVRFPDGSEGEQVQVTPGGDAGPGVGIVAVAASGRIAFVEQYRYVVDTVTLELPRGRGTAEEAPRSAAARELLEETALTARQWQDLGWLWHDTGHRTDRVWVFAATGLDDAEQPAGCWEVERVRWLTPQQVVDLIAAGQIRCGVTLMLLARAEVSGVLTLPVAAGP